ncbi:MAG: potassium-transporting ATPase subunit KdpC [Pseudomonadales bacterium]|uniref:potassium-transporting ATPase subunit KdpC n=1 Tax=Stutzerimonas stutzeri TaxID=316 RepID=UPI000535A09F|nr:potassium-transporting ATPase subunit KdpC [Stutzerimonas stutzeri]MCQ4284916.1 potassium-transporting ATPase subunit KdpC [Stutzerimonas stutzeri]BAP79570.1 potassium-transporting ATPase subunit C [Pseudomonas sp. MT-1]
MFKHIRPALAALILMTLITGVLYPLSVTAVAQLAFAEQANGSLVRDREGQVRGSALLAQPFEGPEWFHPRPSAANYATVASGASNLAPSNPQLLDQARERVSEWNGTAQQPVPIELVTTSGSGLDPHLSLAAAKFQAVRVAAARGISEQALDRLIQTQLTTPLVGPAIVNVLALNLALADNPQPDSGE